LNHAVLLQSNTQSYRLPGVVSVMSDCVRLYAMEISSKNSHETRQLPMYNATKYKHTQMQKTSPVRH